MKAFLFLLLFSPFVAQAFTLNSQSNPNMKGWASPKIQLMVNTSNCPAGVDVVSIIKEAAEVWNGVPTSNVEVSYGGSTTSTSIAGPTTVYCEPNFQAVVGADQNAVPGAAAVDASTGTITRGILYLNVSAGQGNIANFNPTLLKVILAHEIGHILGLGHSDHTHALMYFNGSLKQELNLGQDDIDGVSYLYPSDELDGDPLAGCGRVSTPKSPNGADLAVLGLLFALPLAIWSIGRRQGAAAF